MHLTGSRLMHGFGFIRNKTVIICLSTLLKLHILLIAILMTFAYQNILFGKKLFTFISKYFILMSNDYNLQLARIRELRAKQITLAE